PLCASLSRNRIASSRAFHTVLQTSVARGLPCRNQPRPLAAPRVDHHQEPPLTHPAPWGSNFLHPLTTDHGSSARIILQRCYRVSEPDAVLGEVGPSLRRVPFGLHILLYAQMYTMLELKPERRSAHPPSSG